jgi:hypothetical protein
MPEYILLIYDKADTDDVVCAYTSESFSKMDFSKVGAL